MPRFTLPRWTANRRGLPRWTANRRGLPRWTANRRGLPRWTANRRGLPRWTANRRGLPRWTANRRGLPRWTANRRGLPMPRSSRQSSRGMLTQRIRYLLAKRALARHCCLHSATARSQRVCVSRRSTSTSQETVVRTSLSSAVICRRMKMFLLIHMICAVRTEPPVFVQPRPADERSDGCEKMNISVHNSVLFTYNICLLSPSP